MLTICDTHILLFWADEPRRLSATARAALDLGTESANLACSDISLWEIAMLYARGRVNNRARRNLQRLYSGHSDRHGHGGAADYSGYCRAIAKRFFYAWRPGRSSYRRYRTCPSRPTHHC